MLNGWQRIWVVLVVVSLLFPGLLLFSELPTKQKIYRSWVDDTIDLTLKLDEFQPLSRWQIRAKYSNTADEVVVKKVQRKFGAPESEYALDFSHINAQHESRLENLTSEQVKAVGVYLVVWAAFVAGIYVFGWSIGWIIRGFRRSKS